MADMQPPVDHTHAARDEAPTVESFTEDIRNTVMEGATLYQLGVVATLARPPRLNDAERMLREVGVLCSEIRLSRLSQFRLPDFESIRIYAKLVDLGPDPTCVPVFSGSVDASVSSFFPFFLWLFPMSCDENRA